MKQCPVCKREMREQLLFCPYDGQSLVAVEDEDKFTGLILDEKYRIEEKIGEGGMGKVYRATHIHMDHTVAIKMLHTHLASDQTAMERFRREARAAAYIRHPNAVTVSDFGVTKDTRIAYLVMEFLEGIELRDKIKQKRKLDYEESFIIVQQICLALQAAHAKGIIHRDLKPDNIWLLKEENGFQPVKVLDFGIAKLKESNSGNLTQQGMIVGTPYYMSPEQCLGDELDPRSDLYSLGIIIYEMLTGQVPFQASTPMGIALKHAHEPPKPPHELRPGLPQPIEDVMLRTLRKQRKDRYSSAMELAHEFESALYQAGIELKLLGTNTPPTTSMFRANPNNPYGTQPTLQTERQGPPVEKAGRTGAVSPALAQPGDANAGAASLQTVSIGSLDHSIRPAPARPPAVSGGGAFAARKVLVASIIVGTILAIIIIAVLLTTSKQAPANVNQNEAGSNAGQQTPAPRTQPEIPPAPEGMVTIPAGKFTRGNPNGDENEKPVQEEAVKPFYIDQYEVTNKQYYNFVVDKRYSRWPDGWSADWKAGRFKSGEGERPVTGVGWTDAQVYATWAKKRLPTEVEWEYAARGPDGRLYPWGNEFAQAYANINSQAKDVYRVDSFPKDRSPFNVFGMAGNVSEWTNSVHEEQGKIVVRGGNYLDPSVLQFKGTPAEFSRATRRLRAKPEQGYPFIGFRCARDVPQQ